MTKPKKPVPPGLDTEAAKRGRFKPGFDARRNTRGPDAVSGRRLRIRSQQEWRDKIALAVPVLEKVQARLVERAIQGDVFAGSVIMRHNVSVPRAGTEPQTIPGFDSKDAVASAEAIFKEVAEGRLTLERGDIAMRMVCARCQVSFTAEQLSKLHRIKEMLKARGMSALLPSLGALEEAPGALEPAT